MKVYCIFIAGGHVVREVVILIYVPYDLLCRSFIAPYHRHHRFSQMVHIDWRFRLTRIEKVERIERRDTILAARNDSPRG